MLLLKKITKYIGMRTLKTAIGAALAIFIAQLLGLDYGVNTAIVVILSLQNTKRKSLNLAGVRIASSVIALSIAWAVFSVIGFNPAAFGFYLLLFIPIVVRFRLNEGLVPSSVLVSHLLASNSVAMASLINEFAQMVIGASIALVLNLYIPGIESHILSDLVRIKQLKFGILGKMGNILCKNEETGDIRSLLSELSERIKLANQRVTSEHGENFNRSMDYYFRYLKMETDHLDTLEYMERQVTILSESDEECGIASEFTVKILEQLKKQSIEKEAADTLKEYLDAYSYRGNAKTREEFRNKAALFEYLTDLYRLLEIKSEFLKSLNYNDRKLFREMHEEIFTSKNDLE
jgi:uncharacterized membrane protein YgaE (UPF0421/DUF939 family)